MRGREALVGRITGEFMVPLYQLPGAYAYGSRLREDSVVGSERRYPSNQVRYSEGYNHLSKKLLKRNL